MRYEWIMYCPASNSHEAVGECENFEEAKRLAEEAAVFKYGFDSPGFRIRLHVADNQTIWRKDWDGISGSSDWYEQHVEE